MKEEPKKYSIRVGCTNCLDTYILLIACGLYVADALANVERCRNCGCRSLIQVPRGA